MKINCQRGDDGKCTQCGVNVRPNWSQECPSGPLGKPKLPCINLGEPTGDEANVLCRTCCGNTRKKYPVHACAVFGECLPSHGGEVESSASARHPATTYQGCKGCASRPEPTQPPDNQNSAADQQ